MTCRHAFLWPLLAAIIFTIAPCAEAQYAYTGVKGIAHFEISDRWLARAHLALGHGHADEPYNAFGAALGAGFKLSRDAMLAGSCSLTHANYSGLDNNDLILHLTESISWRRPSGFFFGFYFEQRRLIYRPSDYKINTSCFGGLIGYEHTWQKTGILARAFAVVTANAKSENSSAQFIQRVKGFVSLRKRVVEVVAIGADYSYAVGGEHQIYIADRDGLHLLNVAVDISLRSPSSQ